MSTDSRVVLITGANTGIGLEIVKALYKSSQSYHILLGSRSVEKGEEALKAIQSEEGSSGNSSSISVYQADVTSDSSLEKLVADITEKYGKLDVLVNNAGISLDNEAHKGNLTLRAAFNASWDTNVTGAHVLTHLCIPLLLRSADPRLIFMTSGASSLSETERFDGPMYQRLNAAPAKGWPKPETYIPMTGYKSTKTGLNMMMREWCRVLREDGVKVWAVSPGFLATGLAGVGRERLLQMGAKEPHLGGEFVRDVIEGKRDQDAGKVIRSDMIQPW